MVRRLLLLRHARIAAEFLGKLVGSTDVPLDGLGASQARSLAARVARWKPEAGFCSPMRRCRQTATAAAPGLMLQVDNDLREIDFGQWECRTFAEAAADDPTLADRWATFSPDLAFPGGEDLDGFLRRVRAVADRLIQANSRTVLAVTHGGVIRAMMCHLLGLEPRHFMAFDMPYAALVVLDVFGGKGLLRALEPPEPGEEDDG